VRIQKANTESRQGIASSKGIREKGNDHFAKILEERRKASMPQFNLQPGDQTMEPQPAAKQPESVSRAVQSPDIEQLASEIVDHIASHQTDGARFVEIQFTSHTLDGLRVSVKSEQGSIAVNFQTPVARIAVLLQRRLGTLRSALEAKGIRVSQLAVSR
jgi:flagellar hook-length control protein FliK